MMRMLRAGTPDNISVTMHCSMSPVTSVDSPSVRPPHVTMTTHCVTLPGPGVHSLTVLCPHHGPLTWPPPLPVQLTPAMKTTSVTWVRSAASTPVVSSTIRPDSGAEEVCRVRRRNPVELTHQILWHTVRQVRMIRIQVFICWRIHHWSLQWCPSYASTTSRQWRQV